LEKEAPLNHYHNAERSSKHTYVKNKANPSNHRKTFGSCGKVEG